MRAFLSLLLVLNVAVFAKRFGGSEVDNGAVVEVVNGREVQVFGEDVTEEMGVEDLDKGVVVGDAWMKKLKVKRMKGNLSAATLPSAWKGRFELGELLGEGGFGQVYKMKVTCDGSENSSFVSAKFLKRSPSWRVLTFAERIDDQHKELQRMQARWSEYVVSTVGSPDAVDDDKPLFPGNPVVGDVKEGQWVMMPLYNAGSFKDLLKSCSNDAKCSVLLFRKYDYAEHPEGWIEHRKEATWESLPGFKFINRHAVLALFDNALAGLQAIHKQGLVHMDLKPDNIMLNCKGEDQNRNIHDCYGVVIDLGTLCNKTICSTEKVTGTRGYFAPEVMTFDPWKMYIPANDVWAMGVVLFSLLYLDTPTYMDGYTRDKLFNYKVREDPRVPKEPSEIDQLVIDMLETDYEKRVTLREVRRRLRLYLHRQSVWSSFSVARDLAKMLDTIPSERGVAEDLPSCINGGA